MPLPGWLADPALTRCWAVLRDRMEARGLAARGSARLGELSRAERHAVSGLIGRPVIGSTATLDLRTLDERLASRSGLGGLLAVIEVATGAPLQDRPALRAGLAFDREAPFVAARAALADQPLLAGRPWFQAWLDGVRRSGLLARAPDPVGVMRVAVQLLPVLIEQAERSTSARTELAAASAGGAHALDDGSPLSNVVLRALAAEAGAELPASAAARRQLWERFGVLGDSVSTTCLTLGLRGGDASPTGRRLDLAADAGDPVHLTSWDLRRTSPHADPSTPVLVCENPRVLEAFAERHGGRRPVVCTAGQPAPIVIELLRRLRGGGAVLRYHGDFDWPGIAITNRLIAESGITPWRMTADDYVAAVERSPAAGLSLAGEPIEPVWDAELGATMRHHQIAVHEEAVLETLLADISS